MYLRVLKLHLAHWLMGTRISEWFFSEELAQRAMKVILDFKIQTLVDIAQKKKAKEIVGKALQDSGKVFEK